MINCPFSVATHPRPRRKKKRILSPAITSVKIWFCLMDGPSQIVEENSWVTKKLVVWDINGIIIIDVYYIFYMSSVNNPGWLFIYKGYIIQPQLKYGDYFISHEIRINQDSMECHCWAFCAWPTWVTHRLILCHYSGFVERRGASRNGLL